MKEGEPPKKITKLKKNALVMKLVDILVLGTSAERRAGSNPAEGRKKVKIIFVC